jgi:hypothetical protein
VATRGVFGVQPLKFRSFDKAEPNSHFRGKYVRNNVTRTRVSLIWKLSGTPDMGGLPPPHSGSLCPLSSTEFVEPTPRKKFWQKAASNEHLGYATAHSYVNHYTRTHRYIKLMHKKHLFYTHFPFCSLNLHTSHTMYISCNMRCIV